MTSRDGSPDHGKGEATSPPRDGEGPGERSSSPPRYGEGPGERSSPGERPAAEGVTLHWRGRPAWLEIDLDAVAENTRRIARWVGPATAVMAVVKAGGYGLGAVAVAGAALAGGATWLGVAAVDEGVQLRRAGIDCPILVLGPSTPWEMAQVVATRLTITANNLEVAHALAATACQCRVRAPVHLKLDSGLHRFGRAPDELLALAEAVAALPGVRLEGLYTHFANAGDPVDDFAGQQLEQLLAVRRRLAAKGIAVGLLHAASSAPTLAMPESHLDLVRVGIMLSGHYPGRPCHQSVALQPAVTWRARVARVFRIGPGDSVGYGRTYVAAGPRMVALVPVGYADGYHRVLSNRGRLLVGGRRAPVIGRVSMDQLTIDVTDIPNVREGDPVVVAGAQEHEYLGFDELAELAGTISYELLSQLNPRLPRVYLQGGVVTELTTLLGQEDLSLVGPLAGVLDAPGPAYANRPLPRVDIPQSWLDEPAAAVAGHGRRRKRGAAG